MHFTQTLRSQKMLTCRLKTKVISLDSVIIFNADARKPDYHGEHERKRVLRRRCAIS